MKPGEIYVCPRCGIESLKRLVLRWQCLNCGWAVWRVK